MGPNSGGRCRNRDSRDGGSSSSVATDPDNVKPFGNTHYNGGGSGGSGNYLEPVPYYKAREITFLIKRSTFGRKGWKVMPQEEGTNLRMLKAEVMEAVMARIRELELSGLAVPEQMTLSVR